MYNTKKITITTPLFLLVLKAGTLHSIWINKQQKPFQKLSIIVDNYVATSKQNN